MTTSDTFKHSRYFAYVAEDNTYYYFDDLKREFHKENPTDSDLVIQLDTLSDMEKMKGAKTEVLAKVLTQTKKLQDALVEGAATPFREAKPAATDPKASLKTVTAALFPAGMDPNAPVPAANPAGQISIPIPGTKIISTPGPGTGNLPALSQTGAPVPAPASAANPGGAPIPAPSAALALPAPAALAAKTTSAGPVTLTYVAPGTAPNIAGMASVTLRDANAPAMSAKQVIITPTSAGVASAASSVGMTSGDLNDFLTSLIDGIANSPLINPALISGLGQNNIYTYRSKICKLMVEAHLTAGAGKIVVQVHMKMKNHKRLVSGILILPENVKNDTAVAAAIKFIEDYCCAGTRNQGAKIPSVKIPESLPEICVIIFITEYIQMRMSRHRAEQAKNVAAPPNMVITPDDILELTMTMLQKPWVASLALDHNLQIYNMHFVREMWNSWGETPGRKVNSANEKLAFNEQIYLNQVNDRILLKDLNGNDVAPSNKLYYSADDMVNYVSMIISDLANRGMNFVGV